MGDETVRVVVFEEGDRFVAQCLEYDICVEGRTIPSLLGRLELTIEAELATCAAAGKDIRAAIGAAPNAYADLWTRRTVQLKRIGPGTSLPLFRLDIGMIENARAAA